MPDTYKVLMFTPHSTGNRQDFNGLTLEQADAKAAALITDLQAEGYRFSVLTLKGSPYIYDGYRDTTPTWVRVRILKESKYEQAQQEPAPGAQE